MPGSDVGHEAGHRGEDGPSHPDSDVGHLAAHSAVLTIRIADLDETVAMVKSIADERDAALADAALLRRSVDEARLFLRRAFGFAEDVPLTVMVKLAIDAHAQAARSEWDYPDGLSRSDLTCGGTADV